MAKAKTETPRKGAGIVANAVAKAIGVVDNSGSLVDSIIASAKRIYKGKDIPDVDLSFIANEVARQRKWSAKSRDVRMSEVRKLVRNYQVLPEAIKKFRAKSSTCTFHQVVKLARALQSPANKTVASAVKACLTVKQADAPTPTVQLNTALTRIASIPLRAPKQVAFRKALFALMRRHNVGQS